MTNNREKTPSPTGNKRAPRNFGASLNNIKRAAAEMNKNVRSRIHTFVNVPRTNWKPEQKTRIVRPHTAGLPHPPSHNRERPRSARAIRALRLTKNPKNANNDILQNLRLKYAVHLPNGVSTEDIQKIRYALIRLSINKKNKKVIRNRVGILRIPLTNYSNHNIIEVFEILKERHSDTLKKFGNEYNKTLKN